METITTMRVNENGNVNVETLKNSDNMENQAGTISKKRSIGKRSQNPNGKKKISIR